MTAKAKRCSHKGCREIGTHYPTILLTPKGMPTVIGHAEMSLSLRVCPTHQREVSVNDFVTDETWPMVLAAFKGAGKAEPERHSLVLLWRPIGTVPFGDDIKPA